MTRLKYIWFECIFQGIDYWENLILNFMLDNKHYHGFFFGWHQVASQSLDNNQFLFFIIFYIKSLVRNCITERTDWLIGAYCLIIPASHCVVTEPCHLSYRDPVWGHSLPKHWNYYILKPWRSMQVSQEVLYDYSKFKMKLNIFSKNQMKWSSGPGSLDRELLTLFNTKPNMKSLIELEEIDVAICCPKINHQLDSHHMSLPSPK